MNKKEIKELKQVTTIEQAYELFDFLVETNKKKFNLTKLAEELTELNELCLKHVNKHKEFRPTKDKFIEEIGDVILRMYILSERFGITEEEIKERIKFKANKFLQYIKEDKYDRGV
jgi:NTP pyrophosphatase (non-canonical NTP hydrolase)